MLSFRYLGYHVTIHSSVLPVGVEWHAYSFSPKIPGAATCTIGSVTRALHFAQFDIRNPGVFHIGD